MVDLRNCKPGDKLISKHGLVLEYVRPLPEGDYMDHEVRYPDEAPYEGSTGTRTHDGYVMRKKRLEEDHDIIRIVSNEVMTAVEWLAEQMMHPSIHNPYIEQALKMEKQQIIEAFENGEDNIDADGCHINMNGAEQYYNETFKKK